ncbi:MAG: cytoplasmic protein [Candidatus Thorarchaeota archaeon]|nr:MAG: cytoplasmic protein [Candidatus Thorarchaeota archaeon]
MATDDNKMQLYHLLLNAIHFHENDYEVAAVLECASPKLLIGVADGTIKLPVFDKAMELEIIDHACRACSSAFEATEAAEKLGVPIRGELKGHSDLLKFADAGYSILTF